MSIPAHGSQAFFVTGKRCEKRVYQAEEAWLKAYQELGRPNTASWFAAKTADQGEYVGFLGNSADNYLEWRDVYSKKGGRYTMAIRYASEDERYITLNVNGQDVKRLSNLKSGHYTEAWAVVEVEIELEKGFNTIRLWNKKEWMPNIDCMTLQR